jgi:hypothetical protein
VIGWFLTGVIVGVLVGLVLAPVLREWMHLRTAKEFEARHSKRAAGKR